MDMEDFRTIFRATGVDLWDLIDAALTVAAVDHPKEFYSRRNHIIGHVDSLTTGALGKASPPNAVDVKGPPSPEVDEELSKDPNVDAFDEMRCNILAIKMYLDDPEEENDEESLNAFLNNLSDMDVTYEALKETKIGRSVHRLSKHPSNEVRRLALTIISKWKEMVRASLPTKEELAKKEMCPPPLSSSISPVLKKTTEEDPRKLAFARKKLQENYQAAQNAKKQRKVKIIDVHEIPKENFPKGRGKTSSKRQRR